MTSHNKYSVGTRLVDLENAVTELRRENREIRVHLGGQLQNLVREATSTIQASLRIPQDGAPGRDGRDGQSIVGPQGERGDVLYIGADEVEAAVKEVRAELLRLRAAVLGRIVQGIKDNEGTSGGQRLVRMHLEKLLHDIEAL